MYRNIITWVKDTWMLFPFMIITVVLLMFDLSLVFGWKPKLHPLQSHSWNVGDCFIYKEHEEWEMPSIVNKIVKEGKEKYGIVVWLPVSKVWDDKIFGVGKSGMTGWFAPLKVDCNTNGEEYGK